MIWFSERVSMTHEQAAYIAKFRPDDRVEVKAMGDIAPGCLFVCTSNPDKPWLIRFIAIVEPKPTGNWVYDTGA